MKTAIEIIEIWGTILTILTAYQIVLGAIGLFKCKKFAPAKKHHRYGVCVAARNEEKVIENFLQSVAQSDYPLENLTVFIAAHNCTDKTAEIAANFKQNGLKIVVYEHQNNNERTKGFALKFLFERIKEDYDENEFDGFFIFDADNVVAGDYFSRMNDAFDAGHKIVTSFRHSKNFFQNYISHGYGVHWLRTCLLENRMKSLLGLSCRVQGTGFLFHKELVKNGWNYTSLTEDRSFGSDAVVQNYHITYCESAVFYDEQPYGLKIALRQRTRWAKGHLLSAVENCPKLLKNMFSRKKNFFRAYDYFFLNFPDEIESVMRKIILGALHFAVAYQAVGALGWAKGALVTYLTGLGSFWLSRALLAVLVYIKYAKYLPKCGFFKRLWLIFTFPTFDLIGKWCTYAALFKKVEWKPIPHDTVVDVKTLHKK